ETACPTLLDQSFGEVGGAGGFACRWKLISIAHPNPENGYAPLPPGSSHGLPAAISHRAPEPFEWSESISPQPPHAERELPDVNDAADSRAAGTEGIRPNRPNP